MSSQEEVLTKIRSNPGIFQSELWKSHEFPSKISQQLKALRLKGLITRVAENGTFRLYPVI